MLALKDPEIIIDSITESFCELRVTPASRKYYISKKVLEKSQARESEITESSFTSKFDLPNYVILGQSI